MRPLFISFLISILVGSLQAQDAAKVYGQFCAGCHGAEMQGSLSGPLIKDDWIYGRRKGDLRRNIKYGIKGTEMIAWGMMLDDQQINALTNFIYEAQSLPPDREKQLPTEVTCEDYHLEIEDWADGDLATPWAIEFISKDLAIISERDGCLRWVRNGLVETIKIQGTPLTHTESSTGGYMDIAIDPNYEDNGWIYLSYSHVGTSENIQDKNAPSLTKIIRGKIVDHQWSEEQTLFQAPDSLLVVRGNRWGCRLLFDNHGKLYFSIGDMAQADDSQKLHKATGKVFRINPDGSIPQDNPFTDTENALPQIFTIGNRNVQGLAQHPASEEIWATEHGPMGGDELNILTAGKNYGWPIATFGIDYSGDMVSDKSSVEGMEDPIYQWTPSNGICPLEFVTSSLFAHWKNQLVAGALAYEELVLLKLDGRSVISEEKILKGYGRVRDVKFGPDGGLYVVLNGPDKILRLVPK